MTAEMLLGFVFAIAAGGLGYLGVIQVRERKAREREHRELLVQFRQSLVQKLGTRGASREFSFSRFVDLCGVPRPEADDIANDLYRQFCRKVMADGVITSEERKKLNSLYLILEFDANRADRLETEVKGDVYRDAVWNVLADGVVTDTEAAGLESLRWSLALADEHVAEVSKDFSRETYLATLSRIVDRGRVTPSDRDKLARVKQVLVIRDSDARALLKGAAENLYLRLFSFVVQDGVVTAEEEEALDWLQDEAQIPNNIVKDCKDRIRAIRRHAEYREGILPTVSTRLILQSGELCHWQGDCRHQYQTPSQQWRDAHGPLIVTGKNVMLQAPGKTLSFSPSRILDIRSFTDGIALNVNGRAGNGNYLVDKPEELEAVLIGLVRRHKYLRVEGYSSSSTRHIPHEVKSEVWARDGGRCTLCSENQYLEFDHIIPHSKGGANSVGNIQLLCRKCNLNKSDRI